MCDAHTEHRCQKQATRERFHTGAVCRLALNSTTEISRRYLHVNTTVLQVAIQLPPLVRLFSDAFEGFAAFFVVHEFAALGAAFGFVALGIVARLRVFTCVRFLREPLREPLAVSGLLKS